MHMTINSFNDLYTHIFVNLFLTVGSSVTKFSVGDEVAGKISCMVAKGPLLTNMSCSTDQIILKA